MPAAIAVMCRSSSPATCTGTVLYDSSSPSPRAPDCPSPQDQTVPSLRSAYPVPYPPVMAVMWLSPGIRSGTGLTIAQQPPVPRCPNAPVPQDQTVPSPRSAYPANQPPATAVTSPSPNTGTGTRLLVVLPCPS